LLAALAFMAQIMVEILALHPSLVVEDMARGELVILPLPQPAGLALFSLNGEHHALAFD
jgi:hypothetical protein